MVAGGRSEAETPGRSPSKKGRHPEGVPQKVHAPPTPPNLEARAFRQPTPAAQVSLLAALLISEVHGPNARSKTSKLPMNNRANPHS